MAPFEHVDPAAYALPDDFVAELQSPALVVHLDRVRDNLAAVVDALGGAVDRWRPHVKTTKIPAVWAELVRTGVRHFKCATTREAALLLEAIEGEGARGDVLLAYPLLGPGLRRLGEIAARHPEQRVSVLCEEPSIAATVPDGVDVFVDVNPGMDRTGIPLDQAERIDAVVRAAGSRLRGVHFYDGHLHDPDPEARRRAVFTGYDRLLALVERLRREGHAVGEVITAGTPAFPSATQYRGLAALEGLEHRLSPGTVVFHDARSEEENPAFRLAPAAVVFARVVSRPRPGRVTCDAGSKSVAAEAGDPVAFALGHPELTARTPSEEHLPFDVLEGSRPELGSGLYLVPRHVCPTINLAEEAVLVDGGDVQGVVPVAARAHDVR